MIRNLVLAAVCLLLPTLSSTWSPIPREISANPSSTRVAQEDSAEFYTPILEEVEGWTIELDPALLRNENQTVAAQAKKALANHLQRVTYILEPKLVKKLQSIRIRLELDNPKLPTMQYHPSISWLRAHGHDPKLARHVHIPRAASLLEQRTWAKHPYVVLHELAHAYHDQFLGFDNEEIDRVFNNAVSTGIYDQTLTHQGKRTKHYALNNAREYFAESTEAYLGVNDFFPFVRAELQEHDPQMYGLMEKTWGRIAD